MSRDFEAKKRKVEAAQRELQEAVTGERKRLLAERATIDKQLAELDAVSGTKPTGKRRTGIRQEVLATIKKNPTGINRADLLTALSAKGDRSAEQSVSNALAALKKAGQVATKDGTYKAK